MTIIILSISIFIILSLIPLIALRKVTGGLLKSTYVVIGLALLILINSGHKFVTQQGWQLKKSTIKALEQSPTYNEEDLTSVYDRSTHISSLSGEKISLKDLPKSVKFDVPLIQQYPELPRGCEVTSLAMLIQHAGVDVDKMTLAKQVEKDPTPYSFKNGVIHFGNPNKGFVGDMYTTNKPGYGVYHEPIFDLAQQYLSNKVRDISGGEFTEVLFHVSRKRPVWVITNTTLQPLPETSFQTWQTPDGPIQITYREHSVIITGYDENYIYVNDPLDPNKNKKIPIDEFIKAWEQMGKQAITYIP
ncbi:C39 family peptidase [Bacillus solimangrovi]|uniref:Peptidase C39-like domain-containing protein n=1 Tax=Bacillus solimangrovi TaxID=1305675 RepID=A0A1E5LDM2_9BACI|nr:C39 family peptidase [Bacillus solimangrovi]OEH92176.1 hypothetical protein BFG57_02585 [Bacillus solimangrovi]